MFLAVTYLVLAFASAVHPASHGSGPAVKSSASLIDSYASAAGKTSNNAPAHEERGCFFCLHGPTVLLLTAFFILFVVRTQIRQLPVPVFYRAITPPTLSVISLRAPPALA